MGLIWWREKTAHTLEIRLQVCGSKQNRGNEGKNNKQYNPLVLFQTYFNRQQSENKHCRDHPMDFALWGVRLKRRLPSPCPHPHPLGFHHFQQTLEAVQTGIGGAFSSRRAHTNYFPLLIKPTWL